MSLKAAILTLVMLFTIQMSYAGGLVISPFRATLNAEQTSAVFNVSNQKAEPMVVQVSTVEWLQQVNGEDIFNETEDIIATPAIVTIPPKATYLIRVGLLKPTVETQEKTYRLFIEEVPSALKQKTGLNIALRASLPVFVKPLNISLMPQITWTMRQKEKDTFILKAHNTGNSHVQVLGFSALLNNAEVFKNPKVLSYLLPNTQKEWLIKSSVLEARQKIQLTIKTDVTEQPLVADLTIQSLE